MFLQHIFSTVRRLYQPPLPRGCPNRKHLIFESETAHRLSRRVPDANQREAWYDDQENGTTGGEAPLTLNKRPEELNCWKSDG